jgi:hypothetical protein
MVLKKLTVTSLNICCIDRIMSYTPHTPHTAYHLFSKRQYEKGGSYNFGKKKEYDRAEKWFKERKEIRRELISAPTILATPTAPIAPIAPIAPTAPTAPIAPTTPTAPVPTITAKPVRLATRGPPPGLTRQKQDDSCDLDIIIPSYDDFIYTEEIVINPPSPIYTLSNNNDILKEQDSTSIIIEGEPLDKIDTYKDQLAEFEVYDAALYDQNIYNQLMTIYQLYLQTLVTSNMVSM